MKNKKLIKLLKKQDKSVYSLSIHLGISPQAANYIVKEKDLKRNYDELKKIAEFVGCDIEDIV